MICIAWCCICSYSYPIDYPYKSGDGTLKWNFVQGKLCQNKNYNLILSMPNLPNCSINLTIGMLIGTSIVKQNIIITTNIFCQWCRPSPPPKKKESKSVGLLVSSHYLWEQLWWIQVSYFHQRVDMIRCIMQFLLWKKWINVKAITFICQPYIMLIHEEKNLEKPTQKPEW